MEHYWKKEAHPDDHKYEYLDLEFFKTEREEIFNELAVKLDHHMKLLGKEDYRKSEPDFWLLAAYQEKELSVLLNRYDELEAARFMKLYGAERVPDQLFEPFIGLHRAIFRFSMPPIYSVLKEFGTLNR